MAREYIVVLPIDPMPRGMIYERGTSIPLHATVMQWFSFDDTWQEQVLSEFLGSVAHRTSWFELESERQALFGPENSVPCYVLVQDATLHALHGSLLDFLRGLRATIRTEQWVGNGFTPHVSDTDGRTLAQGQIVFATNLALVVRTDEEKVVIGNWELLGLQTI